MINKNLVIVVLYLSLITIFSTASTAFLSCSCASYPCSTGTCTGDFCDGNEYNEYTGTCLSDGFGGGVCEIDADSCGSDICIEGFGCGECENSGDCDDDYYFCSGDSRYRRDYSCSLFSYTCSYDDDFIKDCDDYDGNYCYNNDAYYRDYGCSGGYCSFSPSLLADCSSEDTSFNDWSCFSKSQSYRYRYLGVCDLLEFDYCDTVLDDEFNDCVYGCANIANEKEYKYECTGANTYKLYEREIEGLCRIDSSQSWSLSGFGNTLTCNNDYMCENDNIVSSTTPQNPCELFRVSSNLNQTLLALTNSFTIQSTSSQTYTPDVLLYDYTNDGVYDIGYGSSCDASIQNTYCNGAMCCNPASPFNTVKTITPSSTGNFKIRTLALETIQNWDFTVLNDYIVSNGYIDIQIDSGNIETEKNTNIQLDSDNLALPSVTSLCWSDSFYKFECYGDVGDCNAYCPEYDYINANLGTLFEPDTTKVNIRKIKLKGTNGVLIDNDEISICVSDYSNDIYCGSCSDGIQNDDETSIDLGGHCGNCFDSIKNGDETLIDYGGKCGTCFDGIRQGFETLDIDYGGICGNCTGDKKTDIYWALGHELSNIPFDTDYCGDTTNGILIIIQSFAIAIIGVLGVIVFSLIILFIILIFPILANITFILVSATKKLIIDKINTKKQPNKKKV